MASIRDHVRTFLDEMPRITCIERMRQTIGVALAKLTETREDSCDAHQYKLFAVQWMAGMGGRAYKAPKRQTGPNHSPAPSDWREQIKEASLGESTGFLAALADPQADAGLRWVRLDKLNGRAVSVYAFHEAMLEGYLLADPNGLVRVPFKGFLYADAATSALVRVDNETDYRGYRLANFGVDSQIRFVDKSGEEQNVDKR